MANLVGRIWPIIEYIKGPDNNTVDALSRLHLIISGVRESEIKRETVADRYVVDVFEGGMLPLTY